MPDPDINEPATAPKRAPRRALRYSLIALASFALLLGAGFWWLGRESTLQTLVQRIAVASGGQIAISGASGSLYGAMHLGHVHYRSPERNITAEQIDIDWSPLQYFSKGIAINRLHVASLTLQSLSPATPTLLPSTLAPPFQLGIADVQLAKVTLLGADGSTALEDVRFALSGDQARWRLRGASAATPWGKLAADASIGAQRPFALDAKASLTQGTPPAGQQPAQLAGTLHGTLSLLEVSATASSGRAGGDALLTLAPFEPIILRSANINGHGIDPAHFNPAWPQADLRLELTANIAPNHAISGRLALTNQGLAGPLDRQRLPLHSASGRLGGTLTATTIDAVLLDLAAAGKFTGSGTIGRATLEAATGDAAFTLHTDRIDLKALHGSLNTTNIAGDIKLNSNGAVHSVKALLAQDGLRLDVQATLADALLHVQQARLQAGKGSISLSGQISLKDAQAFQASASALHFNPAEVGAYPAADLNADARLHGRLAPAWLVATDFTLRPSRWLGQTLAGAAQLTVDAAHASGVQAKLTLGRNAAELRGNFGAPRDRLDWKLDAPELASLGPQFSGALHAAGVLSGTVAMPALSLTLDGKGLRLFGQHRIEALRASARLGKEQGGTDALVSDIDVSAYSSPGVTLAAAHLQTRGTRAAHTLQLSARNQDFDASAQATGGWNGNAWSGTLDTLENRGRFALALQAPAPLGLASSTGAAGLLHPERIALSNAAFALAGGGSIRLQNLEKTGARWRSTGQAAGLPLAYLDKLAPAWRENASGDLTLGAEWSLGSLDVQATASEPAMAGMLHVYREQGDVALGTESPLALGLRQLDARVDVSGNALRLQMEMAGARIGQARLNGSVQMVHGRIAKESALNLTGSADMASLAWLTPLSGQPGLVLDGALKLALTAGGSIAAPILSGAIAGDKLLLNWAEQGIKLRNGQLHATLAGDRLQLQRLAFDGVEGRAQADGWVRFADGAASMELTLLADKLQALARPDRSLVLSGRGTLVRDQKQFRLAGQFKAERAKIELAAQDAPTLSDDVVILGKAGLVTGKKPAAPTLPLNVDLEADLGEAFYLKGKGLDARLDGKLRILMLERRPPHINGNIRVVSGTYAAYGQKLQIERGLLNFSGSYDNPGLNILALRKRPEGEALTETNVEAGVEVRGTALAPSAKLVSTPTVPDSEKLAWLVLGHGAAGTAGAELGLLTTAAGTLFGGANGGSLQARLANSLGLDDLGLAQAKGLESTVVTLGKRISQRAYLSFEQGASSASSLVKLRYKLNPRITLQFQTGANSALDVLYTWAFD